MLNQKTYFAAAFIACSLCLFLTPLIIRYARRFGVVDDPGHRKLHRKPIPLLGGLSVAVGMWVPVVLTVFYNNPVTEAFWQELTGVQLVMGAGCAMLLLGFLDDLRGVNARTKLLIQVPVAVILVLGGLRFDILRVPFLGVFELDGWGPVVTVLWLVGVTNALNLVDGLDGLATGVALFASATTAILAMLTGSVMDALLMSALAGACLGFLRYNFSPARIFLGDTGSLFLGMTLAGVSVLTSQKAALASSMLIPVLVLGFPIFDTLLAMVRRAVRGKSMFSPDAGHVHHRLLAAGLSQRQAAVAIYFMCWLLGLAALAMVMQHSVGVVVSLAGISLLTVVGMWKLGYVDSLRFGLNPANRARLRALYYHSEAAKCLIRLAGSPEEVFEKLKLLCQNYGMRGLVLEIRNSASLLPHRFQWEEADGRDASCARVETREFAELGVSVNITSNESDYEDEIQGEARSFLAATVELAVRRLNEIGTVTERSAKVGGPKTEAGKAEMLRN